MKKYLLAFFVFLLLVSGVTYMVSSEMTDTAMIKVRWALILYFTVITLAFHIGLEKASHGKPQVFVRYYMGATSLKLMIHLGFILIFAFSYQRMAVPFIVSFLIYYFFFTVFDVGMSWGRFRKTEK